MTQSTIDLMPPADAEGAGRISPGITVSAEALGALGALPGTWTGTGFNVIWRPRHATGLGDHFLQLNLTQEMLVFNSIGGSVPNRGLVQDDIDLTGLRYLQQIHDGSGFTPPDGGGALHVEPGFWLNVPATTDPVADAGIVRLASVPHGSAVMAQGTSSDLDGPPTIDPVDITPFQVGNRASTVTFDESTLSNPSNSQRSDPLPAGIDQALVSNPNKFLTDRIAAQNIVHTTTLHVTTTGPQGIANIPFLAPNADAVDLDASFFIETVQSPDGSRFLQLQYTQSLMLNFNGLSWPHVSVANLILTGA